MRSWHIVLLTTLVSQLTMAKEIFLESQSSVSHRYAVLEDNGKVAFLYLTEPGVLKPIRDVIVYMRVPPIDRNDWEHIKQSGDTPLLPKKLATLGTLIQSPKSTEFGFKWSKDGEAVAVLRNGQPLAFATSEERFGYSRAVCVNSAFANAWEQARYITLFEQ